MMTFEKMADYKRALKAFVRGMIKSKIMTDADGKLQIIISKEIENKTTKRVVVEVSNGTYCAGFCAEVATRIYNKFDLALFEPIIKQFGKLKGFGGLEVKEYVEEE